MSRRRGEFEHRTSIFEGAFRAWSHLGGLDPEVLQQSPPAELDPLAAPIENDVRLAGQKKNDRPAPVLNPDGSQRREYPYEPLPRSGLGHPYVQAILSPWLGPDADNEAIQLGLTTLRTWWQHRRKGESGSAIAALGTEKMKGVVEGYTRHFFTLAHCLIVNDNEQPPRSLHTKMKELEKRRKRQTKQNPIPLHGADLGEDLSPLERLHQAQRLQLQQEGMDTSSITQAPVVNIKGKCVPGKIDLGGVVDKVNHHATQLAHRGGNGMGGSMVEESYGDPNTTPVVLVSPTGSIQIALSVDGITCVHCVKIVETVLRGCNGNKSPIDGLLDAAADRDLNSVLILIDRASNAKRIAFEAARNLAMVGYTAKAKEMPIVGAGADRKSTMDLGSLATAFEVVGSTSSHEIFNWKAPCSCPDNGVLRTDCQRHSQMSKNLFEAFDEREHQVTEYMAGCGMKYGMSCTCGPDCRCKDCALHGNSSAGMSQPVQPVSLQDTFGDSLIGNGAPTVASANQFGDNQFGMTSAENAAIQAEIDAIQPLTVDDTPGLSAVEENPLHMDQGMNLFGMGPSTGIQPPPQAPLAHQTTSGSTATQPVANMDHGATAAVHAPQSSHPSPTRMSFGRNSIRFSGHRNPSLLSYGGNHRMSIASETTFGRAMSGLSALSIDWENLEDFDVNVDHSEHINANGGNNGRRSSLRRSHVVAGTSAGNQDDTHVTFKVG